MNIKKNTSPPSYKSKHLARSEQILGAGWLGQLNFFICSSSVSNFFHVTAGTQNFVAVPTFFFKFMHPLIWARYYLNWELQIQSNRQLTHGFSSYPPTLHTNNGITVTVGKCSFNHNLFNRHFILPRAPEIFFSFPNGSTAPWGPRPPQFSRLHDHLYLKGKATPLQA